MELNVINDQGKPTAKLAASDAAFGREYNEALVHQVVTADHALDLHLTQAAALTRAGGNCCHGRLSDRRAI